LILPIDFLSTLVYHVCMKEIIYYQHTNGKILVIEWLKSLDKAILNRIANRLARIAEGNMGDCKPIVDSELSEFRFDFGKGYRIYFYEFSGIILLLGGDKSTQKKDIKKAEEYFEIWRTQNND